MYIYDIKKYEKMWFLYLKIEKKRARYNWKFRGKCDILNLKRRGYFEKNSYGKISGMEIK